MTVHAKLSASGSKRWINCPGSVKLEDQFPDTVNKYASYGSAAHHLAEICLSQNKNADFFYEEELTDTEFDPPSFVDIEVDDEMVEGVQEYLDYVRNLGGCSIWEQKVDFSPWVPDGFGTADFISINENTLTIVDLKFGKGVQIYAEDNTQGILYALGAYHEYEFLYDIENIKIVIHQPRKDHVDEWDLSIEELLDWGETLKEKAHEALADNPPLNPGEEQCRFCKAKATCRAIAEHNVGLAAEEFTDLTAPITVTDPQKLSNEEIGFLLTQTQLFSDWISAIESYAFNEMQAGRAVPGFKLVVGRSTRVWKDEEKARKLMKELEFKREDLFKEKFVSPPQAEKLLKKKKIDLEELNKLINKPPGAKTFAPESDKRPAIKSDAITDFEKVD